MAISFQTYFFTVGSGRPQWLTAGILGENGALYILAENIIKILQTTVEGYEQFPCIILVL